MTSILDLQSPMPTAVTAGSSDVHYTKFGGGAKQKNAGRFGAPPVYNMWPRSAFGFEACGEEERPIEALRPTQYWGVLNPRATSGAAGSRVGRDDLPDVGEREMGGSIDGFDAADLRDVFLQVALDAHLEGDGGGGAADACAVEADADDLIGGDPDEFDIAAIGLDGGADEVDDLGDALDERGVSADDGCGRG
jgi:hypothetical protein